MIRKTDILAILAMILFAASCTKIEQTESSETMPISYQVIKDIERTKAGELEYDKTIPFGSSAFFLNEGKYWELDKNGATSYIDKATIVFDNAQNKWRSQGSSYYWPENGSLTFFSWSPATINSSVSVDKSAGVCLTDWNTYTEANRTVDFMVADVAADKTANETSYYYNGVPTLFRHQLAKVSFFAHLEKEESGKWTKIKKLYLTNIYAQADYSNSNWSDWEDIKNEWVIYDSGSGDGIELTIASQQIGVDFFMIPQNLAKGTSRDEPKVVIVYDNEGGTGLSKSFSFTTDIESHFWPKGTKTIYSISYGTSEHPIDFDTDVDDWAVGDDTNISIGDL